MDDQGQSALSEGGSVEVRFSGPMMLYGEYSGEEGKPVSSDEFVLYGHEYVFDACKQQGLTFQFESLVPFRSKPVDGFMVAISRVRNRMLGEQMWWGVCRITAINATTQRIELRDVITFA